MITTPKDVYFSIFVMLFHFRSTEISFVGRMTWFYFLGHIFHHYWRKFSSKKLVLSVCYMNKSWLSPFPLGEDVYINYRQLFTLKRINTALTLHHRSALLAVGGRQLCKSRAAQNAGNKASWETSIYSATCTCKSQRKSWNRGRKIVKARDQAWDSVV